MLVSCNYHATDRSMSPVAVAVEAEQRGFAGLFLPEHTHIPASRETPPPNGEDELPEMYWRTFDPIVMLAAVAQATTTLRIGTSVSLPAQHDPIAYAKQIATLDVVSGGRLVLGVGFGWNREEMRAHGVDPRTRRAHVAEVIGCMRALWRDHEATFDGRFVSLAPSWAYPKPVQPGGPPVYVGGAAGPKLLDAVAAWGDGWMPIGGGGLKTAIPALRARAEAHGRDPATLRIAPMAVEPSPGKLEYYAELGVHEVGLRLPTGPADEVRRALDAYEPLLAGFR